MDVKGLAAVVTGGASGLGAATAKRLAEAGAKVTVLDMNAAAAEAMGKELGGLGLACDVGDAAAAEAAMAKAKAAHGPCRVLVNCAGIAPAKRVVGREGAMALKDFETVIRVNLIGSFNLLRLAAAEMAAAEPLNADGERGVIVNTASIAAFEGQIGQVAYAAAKAGIVGMTYVAARDLGSLGIRVNAIAPSLFQTGITKLVPEAMAAALTKDAAFPKRMGKPGEYALLAKAIIENPMLNGGTIRLDAGQRFAPK